MKSVRQFGIVLSLFGCVVSVYAFVSLSVVSLPYQDAPQEILIEQANSMARYETAVGIGVGCVLLGLVLQALARWTKRKQL
jgi:cell division protein FtsX